LVQGVGFRPFVYRLAAELGLSGWVRNNVQGVRIEVEGDSHRLDEFTERLHSEKPARARIDHLEMTSSVPVHDTGFQIRQSDNRGGKTALILPDIATCNECLKEVFDPGNRRFRYPFTNCTCCGPRFSIIESLPYDRANTGMRIFPMCEKCSQEYDDPLDRRFHAQPNACPECGPHLELWSRKGKTLAESDQALIDACRSVKAGAILALKGLGGFQLIVDAVNAEAVSRLRRLKARKDKPLAMMYPNLGTIRDHCHVSATEAKMLGSPESPIVLLKRRAEISDTCLCPDSRVSPDNPYFGIMLPYTPLHYLVMAEIGSPIVATSGNLRDEPICIDEHDALKRLSGIADLFLVHNRPIVRHVDDSIVQVIGDREMVLRNARGYAPTAVPFRRSGAARMALGAHLKSSIAVADGDRIVMSQHIGDLSTRQADEAFSRVASSMPGLFGIYPREVSCDRHTDYSSSSYAANCGLPVRRVQHHVAHILSCMTEHELDTPVLGVAWDGTGLGPDGTIWGGEFLTIAGGSFIRAAHLRTFRLPGNERAIQEPRRAAFGLLWEIFGDRIFSKDNEVLCCAFDDTERNVFARMLKRGINCPKTSSAGRLFDAVASIVDICRTISFEGQAAMKLQFAACDTATDDSYSFGVLQHDSTLIIDWEPMVRTILDDRRRCVSVNLIAAKFHNTLVKMIVSIAERIGERKVVLTGGCFQNRRLLEKTMTALSEAGFEPYRPRRIPPNDGGIALGQIAASCYQDFTGE
jgi:hydrogenase maturation protein HypF